METAERNSAGDQPRITYITGLDGLRGLAIAAAVVFHTGHLIGGYLAVDLFFVLSGYLITALLLTETTSTGSVDLMRFWGRRARRLLPALAIMLVGVAAYARFAASPEELHGIRWDGIATMLYVANWRDIFARSDYWALFTAPSPLQHTWSLAIEEQFYALWPLVVVGACWLAARRKDRNGGTATAAPTVLVVTVLGSIASLASQVYWQHSQGWNRVYYGTDTRAFALLAGAAVSSTIVWRGQIPSGRPRKVLEIAGIIGGGFLALAWFTFSGSSSIVQHGGLPLCTIAAVCLVTAVSHPQPGILARVTSFTPFRRLGVISYGMYLYHWPIMVWLSPHRFQMPGTVRFALQVGITLVVSVLSYHLIEQPIRHGPKWTGARAATVSFGCFAVVTALVVASTTTSALTGTDTSAKALEKAAAATKHFHGTTLMVIGDSVGFNLARDGFAELTTKPESRTVNAAIPGCQYPPAPLVIGWTGKATKPTGRVTCNRNWFSTAQAYRPTFVLYVRSSTEPFRILIDGQYASPCTTLYQRTYRSLLEADIARFAKTGATTVLVTALPIVRSSSMSDLAFHAEVRSTTCGNTALRAVAKADPTHTKLVDLEAEFCPTVSTCRNEWQGVELRADRTHYEGKSARIVASWILGEMGVKVTAGIN